MPDTLFDRIAGFKPLHAAALRAVKGKRGKAGPAAFMANLEREVLCLERELRSGTYRPGRYRTIEIHDPKHRIVSAAPFRDRVVHHALCAVIEPIFERGFIFDTYANRKGKGTHKAVARYERFKDRYAYALRCDIYRYFPAIDHAVLKRLVRRRVSCPQTLSLVDRVIDASNRQEPVLRYFPGDDLFAPHVRRRGLPIGNLTSQFFANLYLDGLDHFCKEALCARGYLRYVDDFVLFHDDPDVLAEWRQSIACWLEGRRLVLHPDKTRIAAADEPAHFLGYVLLRGHRRLPEENVRRFRNRLRGMRDRYRAGSFDLADVECRVRAWIGHAAQADTWRLRHSIFRGGMFDPGRGVLPSGPSARNGGLAGPVRSVSCAAGPGTTNPGTCVRQTATGTKPATETTTTDFGLPARPLA